MYEKIKKQFIRWLIIFFIVISVLNGVISAIVIPIQYIKIKAYKEYYTKEDNKYHQEIVKDMSIKDDYNSNRIKELIEKYSIEKYEINQVFSHWSYPTAELSYTAYANSEFGFRVYKGIEEFHFGFDIVSPYDSKCYVVNDAVVVDVGYDDWRGNYVEILVDGYYVKYCHLDKAYLVKHQIVKRGEVVGLIGSTGRQDGIHLHFEIRMKIGNKWLYMNYVTNSLHEKKVENIKITN